MSKNSNPCFLLYSPGSSGFTSRLVEKLKASFSDFKWEIYARQEDIMKRLRYPRQDIASVILIAHNREALRNVEALQPMLEDIRIVIVLPDGEAETVASAHRFHPRLLSYLDEDEERIIKVLRQIVWKKEQQMRVHPAAPAALQGGSGCVPHR